jgi:hypothetical protein
MKIPFILVCLSGSLMLLTAGGCKKEYSASGYVPPPDNTNLVLNFRPVADSLPLSLDSTYSNFWEEPFQVKSFKFYICQVDLINTDSNLVIHVSGDNHYLVDAADSNTWSIKLIAFPFRYNRISFLIGVDSLNNVGGARTGALDPAMGMFWNSQMGYIMAKLEGISPSSPQPNHLFQYDIGGFSGTSSCLRKPTLLFPYGQFSQIVAHQKSVIHISADVQAWFYNPHDLKISMTPACTTPGPMARDISENYSKMFTVTSISN